MKYKNSMKRIALLIIFSLVIPTVAFAATPPVVIGEEGIYSWTIKFLDDGTQEVNILNNETNEIERIKSHRNADGIVVHEVDTRSESFLVHKVDDTVLIRNNDTLEVARIPIQDATILGQSNESDGAMGSRAEWGDLIITYGSKNTDYNTVSLIASILAAVSGVGWVTSVIISIASYCIGNSIKNVWYIRKSRFKWESGLRWNWDIIDYYQYSNFTGHLGTEEFIDCH